MTLKTVLSLQNTELKSQCTYLCDVWKFRIIVSTDYVKNLFHTFFCIKDFEQMTKSVKTCTHFSLQRYSMVSGER